MLIAAVLFVVAAVVVSGVSAIAGVVQRGRLGPPAWWVDDGGRALVAAALATVLVVITLDLVKVWRR